MGLNRVRNAAFLEGTAGWTITGGYALSVDETTRGAPGRAVLVATGTSAGSNQTVSLATAAANEMTVAPGDLVEAGFHAAAFINGVPVAPSWSVLRFRTSGGSALTNPAMAQTPAEIAAHGEGLNGLRPTFRRHWQRAVSPATGTRMRLQFDLLVPTAGSSVVIAITKPFAGVVPAGRADPLIWDPGTFADPDLALPTWPHALKAFLAQSTSEPAANRIEFQGQAGRPAGRRTAIDPVRRFQGTVRCDPVARAALEAFHRDTPGDFWMVEPDSDRLCVASFAADGAPRLIEARGPTALMGVGLWLETA